MKIFISGGAKNGKSFYAQKLATEMSGTEDSLYYIATMIPHDEEDRARIERHVSEREGWGFKTIERGEDISEILVSGAKTSDGEMILPEELKKGTFLLDSVTALLSNEMFGDEISLDAPERVKEDLINFAKETKNTIFVSDYIYGDPRRKPGAINNNEDVDYTEEYEKGLALIDRALAEVCDRVVELAAGIPVIHKGEE